MRAQSIGAAVLLGSAIAVLAAPVALAQPDAEAPFLAAPGEVLRPGNELHIRGYCPDPDAGPLTSPALTGIEILHDPSSGPPNLNASGVVADGTAPGVYPVTMDCAGQTLQVVFTVEGHPAAEPSIAIAGDGRPQPGDAIDVVVRCAEDVAPPASPVLDIGELTEVGSPDDLPVYVAPATIHRDAEPGEHPLSGLCGETDLGIGFTVYPADEVPAGELFLNPSSGRPGAGITVTAPCEDADTATLTSSVLRDVELTRDPDGHQPWAVRGTTTVLAGAAPGTYAVTLHCGAQQVEAEFTVLEARDGQVSQVPVGAPQTGGGPRDGIAWAWTTALAALAVTGAAVLRRGTGLRPVAADLTAGRNPTGARTS